VYFAIPLEQMQAFLLVLFRVGGIVFFAPVLGSKAVPRMVKIAISLGTAVLLFSAVADTVPPIPNDAILFAAALSGELLIGLAIGLLAQAITSSVNFAGRIVGFHMGMRIANVFDPTSFAGRGLLQHCHRPASAES